MVFEYEVFRRARCGRKEREKLRSLVELIVSLSEKARREGLLSLEFDTEEIKDKFLVRGLRLVVDGTDPAIVQDTLVTAVHASEIRGSPLLSRMMTVAGVLGIQQGWNPELIRRMLESYIGLEPESEPETGGNV